MAGLDGVSATPRLLGKVATTGKKRSVSRSTQAKMVHIYRIKLSDEFRSVDYNRTNPNKCLFDLSGDLRRWIGDSPGIHSGCPFHCAKLFTWDIAWFEATDESPDESRDESHVNRPN